MVDGPSASVPGPSLQLMVSQQRRGAEVFAVDLAVELERRGIVAPTLALTATDDRNALAVPSAGDTPLGLQTLRAVRREAAGVQSVVAHGSRTLPACSIALVGTGVPFAYRSIGDPRTWSSRGPRRLRTTMQLRRAALVAALWPGGADAIAAQHSVPSAKIRVIPNGVPAQRCPLVDDDARAEARARLGLPADATVVGYVGSLTPEKNVGVAIAAVGELRDVFLLVAGDGPELLALEAQADRDAHGRVRFAGTLPGAGLALAASDAVVLPSRTEGMPGVLIEAGLSGRPAVASDVGAVSEIISDGETGVLVSPGDMAGLAAGLRRVLGEGGHDLGLAARRRCLARFEIRVVGAAWADLLVDLARD
ncbi:MAG: glycosyltransferase family 4 protein [Jiangellaceae bacterium]